MDFGDDLGDGFGGWIWGWIWGMDFWDEGGSCLAAQALQAAGFALLGPVDRQEGGGEDEICSFLTLDAQGARAKSSQNSMKIPRSPPAPD